MKLVGRKNAKGATLNVAHEILDGSHLRVGDDVTIIPGHEQFTVKLRTKVKRDSNGDAK